MHRWKFIKNVAREANYMSKLYIYNGRSHDTQPVHQCDLDGYNLTQLKICLVFFGGGMMEYLGEFSLPSPTSTYVINV